MTELRNSSRIAGLSTALLAAPVARHLGGDVGPHLGGCWVTSVDKVAQVVVLFGRPLEPAVKERHQRPRAGRVRREERHPSPRYCAVVLAGGLVSRRYRVAIRATHRPPLMATFSSTVPVSGAFAPEPPSRPRTCIGFIGVALP